MRQIGGNDHGSGNRTGALSLGLGEEESADPRDRHGLGSEEAEAEGLMGLGRRENGEGSSGVGDRDILDGTEGDDEGWELEDR